MKRKEATETVADLKAARNAAYEDLVFRSVEKGVSAAEADPILTAAEKTPDDLQHDTNVYRKRLEAKAKRAEAEALEPSRSECGERLEKNKADRLAADERQKQLIRESLEILAESNRLNRQISELRSSATATLQQTCGDGPAWDDPRNMRFGNPPPAAKVLSQETTHAFRPGNTAVLPSSQFIPANRG